MSSQGYFGNTPATTLVTQIPSGGIIFWSGTIASIPAGWVLCDGTNGTPDLRDRFVVGARQDDAGVAKTNITGSLTVSGGNTSVTSAAGGNHNHGGATGGTALTINQMPAHSHTRNIDGFEETVRIPSETSGSDSLMDAGEDSLFSVTDTGDTGGDEEHDHSITDDGNHTHTIDMVQPYFALALIMKL